MCGEAVGSCRHVKGRTYNGKLCYGELTGAKDAYEWSFVAVPAQRRAGVIKSAGVRLEDEARLGRKYLKGVQLLPADGADHPVHRAAHADLPLDPPVDLGDEGGVFLGAHHVRHL